jgi:hypothetical protein
MRLAAVAIVLVAFAGCRSSHASAPRTTGAIELRPLPTQGLVDEERRGVALRDLRGRRLVWLPGFAVYPSDYAAQSSLGEWFHATRVEPPLLHGPRGWYRLDASRHALIPVRGGRLPLGRATTVVARQGDSFAVERQGRVVLRGSSASPFRILSHRFVQAGRTLLDVQTGRRRKLPATCLAAGFRGKTLIVACKPAHAAEADAPLVLEWLTADRSARPLSRALAPLYAERASVSPDLTWVAVEGDTGCAARYVYVAPARGGAARLVSDKSAPSLSNFSSLLGWSADGRLVVHFEPPYCDEPEGPQPPPRGVFLVDPRTLARTFVTRTADGMWGG